MKVVICGQKAFGAAAFDLVRKAGHDIVGVWGPALGGRGSVDRLRGRAALFGVPWREAGTLTAETLPADVDLILAAHSHDFIGRRTRQKARFGAVGYHPSLLPIHRGRDAVKWTIRLAERVAGGSMYWLSDVTDGGPIAAQGWCFVRPSDTPTTLWERELFPMGLGLIGRVLSDLGGGRLVSIPQDEALATWEPALQQPPLRRPDLPQIGPGTLEGMTVITEREYSDAAVAGLGSCC
jgi:methionyl-tRNA formyltransferase